MGASPDGSKIPKISGLIGPTIFLEVPASGCHGEEIVRDVFSDVHVSSLSHFLILVVIWLLIPCRAVPHLHVEKMVKFELEVPTNRRNGC